MGQPKSYRYSVDFISHATIADSGGLLAENEPGRTPTPRDMFADTRTFNPTSFATLMQRRQARKAKASQVQPIPQASKPVDPQNQASGPRDKPRSSSARLVLTPGSVRHIYKSKSPILASEGWREWRGDGAEHPGQQAFKPDGDLWPGAAQSRRRSERSDMRRP